MWTTKRTRQSTSDLADAGCVSKLQAKLPRPGGDVYSLPMDALRRDDASGTTLNQNVTLEQSLKARNVTKAPLPFRRTVPVAHIATRRKRHRHFRSRGEVETGFPHKVRIGRVLCATKV